MKNFLDTSFAELRKAAGVHATEAPVADPHAAAPPQTAPAEETPAQAAAAQAD